MAYKWANRELGTGPGTCLQSYFLLRPHTCYRASSTEDPVETERASVYYPVHVLCFYQALKESNKAKQNKTAPLLLGENPHKQISGSTLSLHVRAAMNSLDRCVATGQLNRWYIAEDMLNLASDFRSCTDANHALMLHSCSLVYC